jgi:hypothetical protein
MGSFQIVKTEKQEKIPGSVWQSSVGAVCIIGVMGLDVYATRLLEQQLWVGGVLKFIGPTETLMSADDFGIYIGVLRDEHFLQILRAEKLQTLDIDLMTREYGILEKSRRIMRRTGQTIFSSKTGAMGAMGAMS